VGDWRRFIVRNDFERYGIDFGKPASSPRFLQIELTDRCNLKCLSCPRSTSESIGHLFHINSFRKLLAQLPDLQHVSFVGLGESLLVGNFADYVLECSSRGIRTSLTTNGSLVPSRLAAAAQAGLDRITISIDAVDDELLGRIRSQITSKKLSTAFRTALRLAADGTITVAAGITLSKHNLADLFPLVKFLVSLGVKFISIESIHHWGDDKVLNFDSIFTLPARDVIPQIDAVLAWADSTGATVEIFDFVKLCQSDLPAVTQCPWIWDAIVVTASGAVTPCCVQLEPTANNTLGSVHDRSLPEIWNGSTYSDLRESFVTKCPPEYCHGCIYSAEFGRSWSGESGEKSCGDETREEVIVPSDDPTSET
jgi:radical SAM protein with 4Fe4S-binding SPASM domain